MNRHDCYDMQKMSMVALQITNAVNHCGDPYLKRTLSDALECINLLSGELRHVMEHFGDDERLLDRIMSPRDMEQSE